VLSALDASSRSLAIAARLSAPLATAESFTSNISLEATLEGGIWNLLSECLRMNEDLRRSKGLSGRLPLVRNISKKLISGLESSLGLALESILGSDKIPW